MFNISDNVTCLCYVMKKATQSVECTVIMLDFKELEIFKQGFGLMQVLCSTIYSGMCMGTGNNDKGGRV